MNDEGIQYLQVQRAGEFSDSPEANGGQVEASPNPLLVVRSLLRGRYILTLVLALVLGSLGAILGYRVKKPRYESLGLVQIRAIIPDLLSNTPGVGGGDSFIDLQTQLMQQESVALKAMETPEWRKFSADLQPLAVAEFRENLRVSRQSSGELIYIAFKHENPEAAMAAVKAVIKSYQRLYGSRDGEVGDGAMRVEKLSEWRRPKSARLNALQDEITKAAAQAGQSPESLERAYEHRSLEVVKVESELSRLSVTIALLANQIPSRPVTSGPTTGPAERPQDVDLARIAERDVRVSRLLEEKENAEETVSIVRGRYGPNHQQVIDATSRLELVQKAIDKRVEQLRRLSPEIFTSGPAGESEAEKRLRELRANYLTVTAVLDDAKAKAGELRGPSEQVAKYRREAAELEAEVKKIDDAVARIKREESFGRIVTINDGSQPFKPAEDLRPKLAAAGGFGGLAVGVGLMLGIGFFNRRLVSVEDTRLGMSRVAKVLGVLPQLPENLDDPEEAAVAAHCVHHIRALLQLEEGVPRRRVFAVTSPSPGDGKTTLAIALGMSFAASGSRTLLIDCDLVGGGLSSKMERMIRPKIGRVLRREGLITDEQLRHALAVAQQSGKTVGEALASLGYASEADVAHASAVQSQSYVGLADVLAGEPLDDCVTGTGKPGLFVLPLDSASSHQAAQLSPAAVHRILNEARAAFDVVLVDTGPVLGSLEATIVATQADGVVLVMARGEQHSFARRTLDRLAEVGARTVGIVFNRAAAGEVSRFAISSTSRLSQRRLPAGAEQGAPGMRLDTLSSAVGSSTTITSGTSQ